MAERGRLARRLARWAASLDRFGASFYGGAQVGDARGTGETAPPAAPCTLCGKPLDDHTFGRVGGAGRMYCP
jgi:hypothetical protein